MKTLLEKCESFMDAIPWELADEFEQKYCRGEKYYYFLKTNPDEFIRKVVAFSLTHKDNSYFQAKAVQHVGSETVRMGFLSDKKAANRPSAAIRSSAESEPHARVRQQVTFPSESPVKDDQKKGTHGQLFTPYRTHTDGELRESIKEKLFSSPSDHDRYTRLTTEEKRYILRYAGLSATEREVFDMKSRKEYLSYGEIAAMLSLSISAIKKRAVKVDQRILRLLDLY